jgi:hypothetical protein
VTVRLQRGSALMSRVCPLSELSENIGLPWGSTPYSTIDPSGKPEVLAAVLSVDSTPVLQMSSASICASAGHRDDGFSAQGHRHNPSDANQIKDCTLHMSECGSSSPVHINQHACLLCCGYACCHLLMLMKPCQWVIGNLIIWCCRRHSALPSICNPTTYRSKCVPAHLRRARQHHHAYLTSPAADWSVGLISSEHEPMGWLYAQHRVLCAAKQPVHLTATHALP